MSERRTRRLAEYDNDVKRHGINQADVPALQFSESDTESSDEKAWFLVSDSFTPTRCAKQFRSFGMVVRMDKPKLAVQLHRAKHERHQATVLPRVDSALSWMIQLG